MRYDVTYTYIVPKKKSPVGPILGILFIIFVIAAANDDKKKTTPSGQSDPVDHTQLPAVTPDESVVATPDEAKPAATDYHRDHSFNSGRFH